MTTFSHDDPTGRFEDLASEQRWSAMSDTDLIAAAEADPLGFVADHLVARDRQVGAIAVLLDFGGPGGRTVQVIRDAPMEPGPDHCRAVLDVFADAAVELRSPGSRPRLGVIHHRAGPAEVTDLDRYWAEALDEVTTDAGLVSLGVAARTRAGALVRVSGPARGLRVA